MSTSDLYGAETVISDTWIKETLAASPDLAAFVGDRIYDMYAGAPEGGVVYPYVTWQLQSNMDVTGMGSHRFFVDAVYVVRAVAKVDSHAELGLVAAAIEKALATPGGAGVARRDANGTVLFCKRTQPYTSTQVVDGEQVRHLGGIYQVQVNAST